MTAARANKGAAEPAAVDWLARDQELVEGLDHLGVQVVSASLYARLLPGVSNLTERARYFSFFAWVLDAFAKHAADRSADGWRTWIRRHEFTLSAAAVAAERMDMPVPGGLVGMRAARRFTKSTDVDIDAASLVEQGRSAKGSYFKHREGGYGQYYKGPMTVLGILHVDEHHKAPDRTLTTYAGTALAAAVEADGAFRRLGALARSGAKVSVAELAALGRDVHPSMLNPDGPEAGLLRGLILGTDDPACIGQRPHERRQRRQSAALILDYLSRADAGWRDSPVAGFRWSVLERRFRDGRPWEPPPPLLDCATAWSAYAQNELLNYALECLLWCLLQELADAPQPPRAIAARLAASACGAVSSVDGRPGRRVLPGRLGDAVNAHAPPPAEECWGAVSTHALHTELAAATDPDERAGRAARLLLRVAADRRRFPSGRPFATVAQGDGLARAREIHLETWWSRVDAARDQDTRHFFESLIREWIVYRHLRVATRKLTTQGDYTFRMRPEGGALVRCGDFEPSFTNPRVRQCMRILADLGLVAHDLGQVTPHARKFLEGLS